MKIIPVSEENFWVQLFKNLIDFYAPTRLWKLIKYVDIFLAHSMRRNKYLASRKSFTYLSYILCIGLLYNDMRKPVTILRFIWKTIVKIKCLFLMLLYYAPCCARNNGMEFFLKSSFLTYMCLFAFRYCKILTINLCFYLENQVFWVVWTTQHLFNPDLFVFVMCLKTKEDLFYCQCCIVLIGKKNITLANEPSQL